MLTIVVLLKECAQELARCLAEGGDQKGTEAHFRIQEIISARVSLSMCWPANLLACPWSGWTAKLNGPVQNILPAG